jgi:methylenetetrahydrofolate reductase (NADPH)|tara:strand:+ start:153 stop:1013 length:861 start_codon:yes stop_codon:yes gene_type:complete
MFESTEFLFTAETTPQLSTDLGASAGLVDALLGLADAINVTDSPNCQTKLSSLLVAAEIRRKGLDVILQLTGRDRNRIALESELLGALSVDINKVLCLSGDQPPSDGPKAVNEYKGSGLIGLCATLSNGTLTDGTAIKKPRPLFSGAADDLYQHQAKPEAMTGLLTKIDRGARFVQTQYCFDLDIIKAYSDRLMANGKTDEWKVIVGMGPLKSAKQADWMRKNLWGVHISDEILERLEMSDAPIRAGEEVCRELILQIMDLPGIDGVHLMGPSCERQSAEIIRSFR